MHMKCAVTQPFRSQAPSPGRSMTRARRLYVSSLANFRLSDRPETRGSVQGCTLPPVSHGPFSPSMATGTLDHPWSSDGSSGGHPAPQSQSLKRLVCSASYDRALCHTSPLYRLLLLLNEWKKSCAKLAPFPITSPVITIPTPGLEILTSNNSKALISL